jgi:hypothetical protein
MVFDTVHTLRQALHMSWARRATYLNSYQEDLSKGVRDFSTFIPICESVDLILKEFNRSRRIWDPRPLRRKLVGELISKLESALENDTYWLDLPNAMNSRISGAAALSLTLARTKKFLSNQYGDLPLDLREWL